jgi:hypothetical protein
MCAQRSTETERAYQKQAHRHLRRAGKLYPNMPVLAGLIRSVGNDPTIIRPATARLYRQELAAAVDLLIAEGRISLGERSDAINRINSSLAARTGKPAVPRTASRKVKNATQAEVRTVLRYLARQARGCRETDTIFLLILYMMIAPRLGCRPVEWMTASVPICLAKWNLAVPWRRRHRRLRLREPGRRSRRALCEP